jgi:hypothetical protein
MQRIWLGSTRASLSAIGKRNWRDDESLRDKPSRRPVRGTAH